jgi:hypothetical protein
MSRPEKNGSHVGPLLGGPLLGGRRRREPRGGARAKLDHYRLDARMVQLYN